MNEPTRMKQEQIDAAFAAALTASAPKAMYAGATMGGFGWLLSNEGMAFCGLMLAFIGTAVTVWVKVRQDRRDVADKKRQALLDEAEERRQDLEHQARMRLLRQQAEEGRR